MNTIPDNENDKQLDLFLDSYTTIPGWHIKTDSTGWHVAYDSIPWECSGRHMNRSPIEDEIDFRVINFDLYQNKTEDEQNDITENAPKDNESDKAMFNEATRLSAIFNQMQDALSKLKSK